MNVVEDPGAERGLKSKLTLSAAGERGPEVDERPSAPPEPIRIPARRRRRARELPLAAALTVQEYAELAHIPEAELRALWGDR